MPRIESEESATYELLEPVVTRPPTDRPAPKSVAATMLVASLYFVALTLHAITLFGSLGGWAGLNSKNAILRDDHPLYLHSTVVTRSFLAQSGSTAGYDPTFMAGYPKSVVFPASSTLPELVVFAFGGVADPVIVYKWYVLIASLLAPVVILWSASGLCRSMTAGYLSAFVWLAYVWTDFPIQYVGFGMVPYFLSIPLALATLRVCVAWLEWGGFARWLVMTLLLGVTTLTHFTALMVLMPAVIAAWAFADSRLRHAAAGLASGLIALALNAFWWWPGIVLAATKGESGFAFAHPEGVLQRLKQIFWTEAPVESFLLLGLCTGLPLLIKSEKLAAAGLAGFMAGGFFWGYGAGEYRSLDFLQPGRHTFAGYSACAIVTAFAITQYVTQLRKKSFAAALGASLGMAGVFVRLFGATLLAIHGIWTTPDTAPLNSRPPAAYELIRKTLKGQVGPTDRILYEEGGKGPDFFRGGRYSGVLARELGVEFLGGPYLHAALTTNIAQFGEDKLLGREKWDSEWLETVRKRYGLTWIVCWSDSARAVLDVAPERYEVILRDGPLRIARLKGANSKEPSVSPSIPLAGTDHVDGPVVAKNGQIELAIRPSSGSAIDRDVVLRYHWTPNLNVSGPEGIEMLQESEVRPDPALPPLIRLRLKPTSQGPVRIRIEPWSMAPGDRGTGRSDP